jgi:MFS family permease
VAGPGLAGVLVGAFSAPYAIAVDAASFVGSALLMTAIKRVEELPAALAGSRRRMRAEIGEGLGYVFRHPLMRPMMVWVATANFFGTLIGSILIVYAVRVLHISAAEIGLIFSVANVGALVGAVIGTRLAKRFGIGRTLIGLAAANGWASLLIPLASGSLAIPLLVAAQLMSGFCAVAANVNGISLVQAITPDRLLGRMNASRRFVVWGVFPLGGLVGGLLGSTVGIREAIWIGAVGGSVAFVPLLFSSVPQVITTEDGEKMVQAINEEFALRHAAAHS